LRLVLRAPLLRRYRFFRDALAQAEQRPGADVLAELPRLVTDVERLGAVLERRDVSAVLDNCRSVAALRQLHDRWADIVNRGAEERRRSAYLERYGGLGFPQPPLSGNESIVPITTIDELAAEGREMKHCVLAHAPAIFEGRAYVYRVLAPERATLELTLEGPAAVTLAELRGSGNADVSDETRQCVLRWLRPARPAIRRPRTAARGR